MWYHTNVSGGSNNHGGGIMFILVSIVLSVWFGFFLIGLLTECVLETNPFEDGCLETAEIKAGERAEKLLKKVFTFETRVERSFEDRAGLDFESPEVE